MGQEKRTLSSSMPPIVSAACDSDIEAVKRFLDEGADVNSRDKTGRTALHWAAVDGDVEMAQILIEANIDVNAKTKGKWTALHLAADIGCHQTVLTLLKAGADRHGSAG